MSVPDCLKMSLRPSRDVVETELGGEMVLLHLESGEYYGLDEAGTRIWAYLKDGLTPQEICDKTVSEFDVEAATVREDTQTFLAELLANNTVIEAPGK